MFRKKTRFSAICRDRLRSNICCKYLELFTIRCKYLPLPPKHGSQTQNVAVISVFPGKSWGWSGNYGESVQQQGDWLGHDPGAEPRDQQEAAGRAGGHPPQEHHAQGQHQHPRCGNQQDIDKQTEGIKFLAEPSFIFCLIISALIVSYCVIICVTSFVIIVAFSFIESLFM